MAETGSIQELIDEQADKLRQSKREWLEKFARFGFVGKGVIYTLTGIFAALTALEFDDKTKDTKEILLTILEQPFGQILIVLLAAGLLGYALWRFIMAAKNPDDKNIFQRTIYFIIAVFYCCLAAYSLLLAFGFVSQSSGDGETQKHLTSFILTNDFGQIALALVGLGFVIAGFVQIYKGATDEFRECLREDQMSETLQTVAVASGRLGLTARGIVFILIGGFLNFAAYYAKQEEIVGISGALDLVAQQSYGEILMFIVAAGLILYGVNMFVTARYRRMDLD